MPFRLLSSGLLGSLLLCAGCTLTQTTTSEYAQGAAMPPATHGKGFEAVQTGMDKATVYALLGKPQREGLHFAIWEARQKGAGKSILELEFDDLATVRKVTRTDLRLAPVRLDPES